MNVATAFAYDPDDSDEVRLEKITIFIVAASCCVAAVVWTAMYYFIFGLAFTTYLPLLFGVIVGGALVASHLTRNHYIAVYAQITCIMYITAFIQWSIGGLFDSGFVLAWALCGPLIALMFLSRRQAVFWLVLFLVNIAITVTLEPHLASHGLDVTPGVRTFFFVMNLSVSAIIIFAFASYFVSSAINEREKANKLLLNILPPPIAKQLKEREGVIANQYPKVCVLFADIVEFTRYSDRISAEELVTKLNEIFLRFDELAERHGLEKIKTIGDAYMIVAGVPEPTARCTQAMATMAFEMVRTVKTIRRDDDQPFSIRIGMHAGPVVGGVIGKSKFAFDLWGDTVNVASRMESSGTPDRIQVSETVYQALKDDFIFEKRGKIEIKGKGLMDAYYLISPRPQPDGELYPAAATA